MNRIKRDDLVKIISGVKKGTTGKVLSVNLKDDTALVDGVGIRERHMRANAYSGGRGISKNIQVAVPMSKLSVVVDSKKNSTSRIGYLQKEDGKKVRIARQASNKEIK